MPPIAYTPSKNSCCSVSAKSEEHIGNSHKLSQIERLLDFASPFGKRERRGPRSVCRVSQPKHYCTRTFQEEYRELLRKHGVDFDERYAGIEKLPPKVNRAFSANQIFFTRPWGDTPGSPRRIRPVAD